MRLMDKLLCMRPGQHWEQESPFLTYCQQADGNTLRREASEPHIISEHPWHVPCVFRHLQRERGACRIPCMILASQWPPRLALDGKDGPDLLCAQGGGMTLQSMFISRPPISQTSKPLRYNYVEMARVTGTPINFLLNRGQMIKVQSFDSKQGNPSDILGFSARSSG